MTFVDTAVVRWASVLKGRPSDSGSGFYRSARRLAMAASSRPDHRLGAVISRRRLGQDRETGPLPVGERQPRDERDPWRAPDGSAERRRIAGCRPARGDRLSSRSLPTRMPSHSRAATRATSSTRTFGVRFDHYYLTARQYERHAHSRRSESRFRLGRGERDGERIQGAPIGVDRQDRERRAGHLQRVPAGTPAPDRRRRDHYSPSRWCPSSHWARSPSRPPARLPILSRRSCRWRISLRRARVGAHPRPRRGRAGTASPFAQGNSALPEGDVGNRAEHRRRRFVGRTVSPPLFARRIRDGACRHVGLPR